MNDYVNDVWSSKDGINWNLVTEHAGWTKRDALGAVVHNDKIYVMGGHDEKQDYT